MNPFTEHSHKLVTLLTKSKNQKDPGLWLYKNNARTHLFMMEGISRLFYDTTNDEAFYELKKTFKKLEDKLGLVDYYDSFILKNRVNKDITKESLEYLNRKKEKAIDEVNKTLLKKEFLTDEILTYNTLFTAINKNLSSYKINLQSALNKEIREITMFMLDLQNGFTDLESHVHELRRKLRWLAIYTFAFQGLIKLTDDNTKYDWIKQYIPKSLIKSPFVNIPVNSNFPFNIYFSKPHFYALSYLIQQLGEHKDIGFNIEILSKAIRKTTELSKADAVKSAIKKLGYKTQEEEILSLCYDLSFEFIIKENILGGLIVKEDLIQNSDTKELNSKNKTVTTSKRTVIKKSSKNSK